MDFSKFSKVNLKRCVLGFRHKLDSWSIAEWTNAVAGEAGEACNAAKKLLRHRDDLAGNYKKEDLNQRELHRRIARELADVIIYADLTIQALGEDTSKIVIEVFNQKSKDIGCADMQYEEDK